MITCEATTVVQSSKKYKKNVYTWRYIEYARYLLNEHIIVSDMTSFVSNVFYSRVLHYLRLQKLYTIINE